MKNDVRVLERTRYFLRYTFRRGKNSFYLASTLLSTNNYVLRGYQFLNRAYRRIVISGSIELHRKRLTPAAIPGAVATVQRERNH